ncbi:hypothetical protein LPJ57_006868 [Coemansia sp. RSA 486]|nr:hypothetical protein LPJ57_006868 [Coemansia sp. RSA 486]KAJ2233082.1 hypothetical protein IWW45_004466 [Coemansia sp. RSA 485]
MKVSLLVRSSSIPTDENFKVLLSAEQTVGDLKQVIEKEHPASPRARSMRVIWRGRLLKDTLQLSSLHAGEDPDAPRPEIIHSVVHFVADVTVKMQGVAGHSKSHGKKKEGGEAHVEQDRHAGSASIEHCQAAPHSLPTPSVIPLGSTFQYVLIDGAPYVVERRAHAAHRPARSNLVYPEQQAASGGLDMQEFNARMLAQHRTTQQTGHVPVNDQGIQRDRAGDNLNNAQAHHPLADVFRNLTFGNIWSVIWVLLRLLLFVVVFAHDASWDRMFLLAMLIAGFVFLRSEWAQQRLAWLQQYERRMGAARPGADDRARDPPVADQMDANGDWHPDADQAQLHNQQQEQQREFSALEKARALVIALFTTLIPAEPFHVPAPAEE